jgi:Na+/serine symporter
MLNPELIEKVLIALAAVSGCSWKLVEIFKPLFNKLKDEDIRGMVKAIFAGILGWGLAWAFGVQTLNALGYNLHPALDAVVAGLLTSGGAAVFNVLYDILKVVKDLLSSRVGVDYAKTDQILGAIKNDGEITITEPK